MSALNKVPSFGSSLMNLGNSSNNFSLGSGLAFLGDSLRGTFSVSSNLGLLASQSIGNLTALATSTTAPPPVMPPPAPPKVSSIGSNMCGMGAVVRNASLGSLCDLEHLGDDWGKVLPNSIASPQTWQMPRDQPALARFPSANLLRVDSLVFSPNRAKMLDEKDQKDREWQNRLHKIADGKIVLSPEISVADDPASTVPGFPLPHQRMSQNSFPADDETTARCPSQKAGAMDTETQSVVPFLSSPENEQDQQPPLPAPPLLTEAKVMKPPDEGEGPLQRISKTSDTDDRASSVSVETSTFKRRTNPAIDIKGSTSAMSRKMTDQEHSEMLYKRKLRNRESAARSRKRHQSILQHLQNDLNELAVRADEVVASCDSFSSKNAKLRDSNMRLYCENAYLRAQLSMVDTEGSSRTPHTSPNV